MLSNKQFEDIKKNGITFELSENGKYANIYKRGKFVASMFGTKNTVYFCGKEFVETTTKEIIEFLNNNTNTCVPSGDVRLTNDEAFLIWKRCVIEDRPVKSFEIELGTKENYIYNILKRLGLPKTFKERHFFDKTKLENIMKQNSYEDAKQFLGGSDE